MALVRHRVGIQGARSAIYAAITQAEGLASWWSTTATGECSVRQALDLGFGESITLTFFVCELELDKSILLECPNGPGPWGKSRLCFELEDVSDQVLVTLIHSNEQASDDDFLYFNTKWPLYLLSLRDYIETGTGQPCPNDVPIYYGDNVNSNTN